MGSGVQNEVISVAALDAVSVSRYFVFAMFVLLM
jgi:hypothetical protein